MALESTNVAAPTSKSSWGLKGLLSFSSRPLALGVVEASVKGTKEGKLSEEKSTDINLVGSSSSSSSRSSSRDVCKCFCCGALLYFPSKARKYRCSMCQTTNLMDIGGLGKKEAPSRVEIAFSFVVVNDMVEMCFCRMKEEKAARESLHDIFEPLSTYLYNEFKCWDLSNRAPPSRGTTHEKYSHRQAFNAALSEIQQTFNLLTKLPTKRPLFCALKGADDHLKRIPAFSLDNMNAYRSTLLFLEIPILSRALVSHDPRSKLMSDNPEIKTLCYEVLKRSIGIISCIDDHKLKKQIVNWFASLDAGELAQNITLVNLYITFQLKKYFYLVNNPQVKLSPPAQTTAAFAGEGREYFESSNLKAIIEANPGISTPEAVAIPTSRISSNPFPAKSSRKTKNAQNECKIKLHQYSNDWRVKSAFMVMAILYKANNIRKDHHLPVSHFYNSLVDFVNIRQDFDSWQRSGNCSTRGTERSELTSLFEYLHNGQTPAISAAANPSFFICQYPFLMSLGSKISILEFEARRQMERKAEEAFINSLDKRILIDIHLRIKVRRDHIVQDSLQCIKSNMENLKKSLKVQFIDEPGVDAGGLRKEWFYVLTKQIFHPSSGMFYNVEDSNFLWFNLKPVENSDMYYLFGAILGLAIYNSTILDLQFPTALYKVVLGKMLDIDDYKEIYPKSHHGLMRLKELNANELRSLELTFEISFQDVLGTYHNEELLPNGSKIKVDRKNLDQYISRYCAYMTRDGISTQLEAFTKGFNGVIGGNALSLFSEEEIRLLLCGNDEHVIDIDILQSVTKYGGWTSSLEAANSSIVRWFWNYMRGLDNSGRKKVLMFVTGSDRVPATGIQNLPFKLTLLDHGFDSDRLPVAHTCFNELAIYNYSSCEKLVSKLTKAVAESSGFGIK